MKIGFTGVNLPEGKMKYQDDSLEALVQKDKPKKVSPYYGEFIANEFDQVDVIVISRENILDLLILDMEKLETRISRLTDPDEGSLLAGCLESLENEIPLCDMPLTPVESRIVAMADPYSLKPVIIVDKHEDPNHIISLALERAGYMFFYTSGPRESHAWLVKKNSDIVTCAGKIHTDLARGFIKGDVVSFEDYLSCHSFNQAKAKGLARLTDRDYIVQSREVIEIRFNVSR
jgi:hypothetical protein